MAIPVFPRCVQAAELKIMTPERYARKTQLVTQLVSRLGESLEGNVCSPRPNKLHEERT